MSCLPQESQHGIYWNVHLITGVSWGGLRSTRLHGVVKAAVVVGLHVQVAVHAVADLQLRAVTAPNINCRNKKNGRDLMMKWDGSTSANPKICNLRRQNGVRHEPLNVHT